MAKRWPHPEGFTPRAVADVTGIVFRQEPTVFSPILKSEMCRVKLEVGEDDVDCVATGELAEVLSGYPAGSAITVRGRLRCHDAVCELTATEMETA